MSSLLYFKSLFFFSFREKINILLYSLANRILNKTNKNTNRSFEVIKSISNDFPLILKKGTITLKWQDLEINLLKKSSDLSVFKQVIIDKEYQPVLELIKDHKISIESILDAGANIGLSTIYLNHFLQPKEIICLEPSESTFSRLENNISKNKINAQLIQAGLWRKDSFLSPNLNFRDGEDWSFSLEEKKDSSESSIQVFSIETILKKSGLKSFDFIKIDIEGGEEELFEDDRLQNVLSKTKIITVEIHDEKNCRRKIEQDLTDFGFKLFHSHELTIGLNQKLNRE